MNIYSIGINLSFLLSLNNTWWQLCILVAGALGGRFDHEIGNINVLCLFSNTRIILLSDDCLIHLLPKNHSHKIFIQSVEGPHCGLVPIGIPCGSSTTTGLEWDLSKYQHNTCSIVYTPCFWWSLMINDLFWQFQMPRRWDLAV